MIGAVQSRAVPRFPKPHTTLKSGRATFRFYLGDSVELLGRLAPGAVSAIVTSPPYNLGIRYHTYDDTLPRERYLAWTGEWVRQAARALTTDGSLFLNVGAKPTDPWTAIDVAQAARVFGQAGAIAHSHFRDCPWSEGQRPGAPDQQIPGRGEVDIPGVLRALVESGYTGVISLEVIGAKAQGYSLSRAALVAAEARGYLRRCLEEL